MAAVGAHAHDKRRVSPTETAQNASAQPSFTAALPWCVTETRMCSGEERELSAGDADARLDPAGCPVSSPAGVAGRAPPSALATRTMPFIQGWGVQWKA